MNVYRFLNKNLRFYLFFLVLCCQFFSCKNNKDNSGNSYKQPIPPQFDIRSANCLYSKPSTVYNLEANIELSILSSINYPVVCYGWGALEAEYAPFVAQELIIANTASSKLLKLLALSPTDPNDDHVVIFVSCSNPTTGQSSIRQIRSSHCDTL